MLVENYEKRKKQNKRMVRKSQNEKHARTKFFKWRVRGSPRSGLYLKQEFVKQIVNTSGP